MVIEGEDDGVSRGRGERIARSCAGDEQPLRSPPRETPTEQDWAQRAERERERNRRRENAKSLRAGDRRGRPTVPEQQMISVLAALGERYGEDYEREYKIKAGERYITHVDFAWPREHLVIEVYGGPHYKEFFDRAGQRDEREARRIQAVASAGWEVLIVFDYEMSQDTWLAAVEKVEDFLEQGRDRWPRPGR